jgi:tetratricopeptide (TPR) repeat protein
MKVITSEAQLIRTFTGLLKRKGHYSILFKCQRHTKEIFISNGYVLFATSNLLSDKLSEVLFKAGKLTQDQYMLSTELSLVTKKKMGEILVNEGFLTKDEIAGGLCYQAKKIFRNIFEYPDWNIKITDFKPEETTDVFPGLSLIDAVMAGIRSVDNITVIFDALPRKGDILEVIPGQEELIKTIRLTRDESLLVLLIDGCMTLEEVMKESKMMEYHFYKTIYPLLALKVLKVHTKPLEIRIPVHASGSAAPSGEDPGDNGFCVLPPDPSTGTQELSALFEEAKFLISSGQYSDAANKLKHLIRLDSKRSEYYYYLGLALDHIPGQNKEAEKVLKIAIHLENYNSRYYLALGYLYLNRNMKRQARKYFLAALKRDPHDSYVNEALNNLDKLEKKGAGFLTTILFRK